MKLIRFFGILGLLTCSVICASDHFFLAESVPSQWNCSGLFSDGWKIEEVLSKHANLLGDVVPNPCKKLKLARTRIPWFWSQTAIAPHVQESELVVAVRELNHAANVVSAASRKATKGFDLLDSHKESALIARNGAAECNHLLFGGKNTQKCYVLAQGTGLTDLKNQIDWRGPLLVAVLATAVVYRKELKAGVKRLLGWDSDRAQPSKLAA